MSAERVISSLTYVLERFQLRSRLSSTSLHGKIGQVVSSHMGGC